jgi:hypothetical protein
MNLNFINDDSVIMYIKDVINNFIKYFFTGLGTLFTSYDELGVDDIEFVKFDNNLQLNFILDKTNNITLSTKMLFLNDLDIMYDLSYNKELVKMIDDYSPNELGKAVQQILDNESEMMTELYDYNSVMFNINVEKLAEDYEKVLSKPESVGDITKHVILNSILRSGTATVSDIMQLFNVTEYLSVNKIIYSVNLKKD